MDDFVYRVNGPTILTYTGRYFDYSEPERHPFRIEDIAHALSNLCRYNGHCRQFYSVAQHSVHMSHQVDPELQFMALMHDAPEAYVGDMNKPLKVQMPEYGVMEKRVEKALFSWFGLPEKLPKEIKEADIRMLRTEQMQIMNNNDKWTATKGIDPYPIRLPFWGPEEAKRQFLIRYGELTGKVIVAPDYRKPRHHEEMYHG